MTLLAAAATHRYYHVRTVGGLKGGIYSNYLQPQEVVMALHPDLALAAHGPGSVSVPDEWDYQRIPGCKDTAGDDDIEIYLRPDNKLHVY